MSQKIIGLDVGTWSVKAALVESTFRGFTLMHVQEHHIPRGPDGKPVDEDLTAAVRATLLAFRDRDTIITAVPGRRALSREMTLPFADEKRIRSVLPFQLDAELPKDVEDLAWDHLLLEEGEDGTKLLCFAVEKEFLRGHLAELQSADADPRIVTLDTLAAAWLVPHLGPGFTGEPLALVDLGHTTTSVTIVEGGRVRTVRTLGRGGHHVTLALMKALEIDYGQAEQVKHGLARLDGGLPDGADPGLATLAAGAAREALEPVFRDVRLTLHGHANRWGRPVTHALLFGGTAKMPGTDEALAAALGIDVSSPDLDTQPWSGVRFPEGESLGWPKAAGLALLALADAKARPVDFRQDDLAYESDFKAVRDKVGWLLLAAAVLVLAFFGRQYVAWQVLESNHETLVTELRTFSENVLGEPRDDFDFVRERLVHPPESEAESVFPHKTAFRAFWDITEVQERVNATAAGGARGGDAVPGRAPGPREDFPPGEGEDELGLPPPPMPGAGEASGEPGGEGEVYVEPDDGKSKVELKQAQVGLKSAFIKGEANNIEAVEAFTTGLKAVPCFQKVETNETTRISFGGRQDWLRFQLRIDIECAPEGEEKDREKEKEKEKKPDALEALEEGE